MNLTLSRLMLASALLVSAFPTMGTTQSALAQTSVPCTQIVIASVDGTSQRTVTSIGQNSSARWSPDGSQLVFASSRDGGSEIYTRDLSGKKETRLTHDGSSYDPSWTPDGKIVFSHSFGKIGVMNADGSGERDLPQLSGIFMRQPVVSPDGQLVASWGEQITTNGYGGSELVYLTKADGKSKPYVIPGQTGAKNWNPTWKSATVLSFVSQENGVLMSYDLPSKTLTAGMKVNGLKQPAWSKNGSLAYGLVDQASYSLIAMQTEGQLSRVVALGEDASWSPDGTQFVFTAYRCGSNNGWYYLQGDIPIFEITDVQGVGKDNVVFSTAVAGALTHLVHKPFQNVKGAAQSWGDGKVPIAAQTYSSTWTISDTDQTSFTIEVDAKSPMGARTAQYSFARQLFHLKARLMNESGSPVAGKVRFQGPDLDKIIDTTDGLARLDWNQEGVYYATPISGTEPLSGTQQLLLLGHDAQATWTFSGRSTVPVDVPGSSDTLPQMTVRKLFLPLFL